jgi:hypothetical protein
MPNSHTKPTKHNTALKSKKRYRDNSFSFPILLEDNTNLQAMIESTRLLFNENSFVVIIKKPHEVIKQVNLRIDSTQKVNFDDPINIPSFYSF